MAFRYQHTLDHGRNAHDDTFRRKHPPMDLGHRAKIFSPFDALRGFNFEITKKAAEQLSVPKRLLDESELDEIDRTLRKLKSLDPGTVSATILSFIPNPAHCELGHYVEFSGTITLIGSDCLMVEDQKILFQDIAEIKHIQSIHGGT